MRHAFIGLIGAGAVDKPVIRAVALVLATLLLPACQSASPSAATGAAAAAHPLIGTSWLAQDIDERGVLPDLQSTLTVESAERVSGHGGCNRYFGRVELEESNIGISRVGSTRMACPPAVMDQERRFMNALQAASSWERGGDILIIFDGERRQRLRLSAVLPPSSSPRAGGDTRVFNAAGHSPAGRSGSCLTGSISSPRWARTGWSRRRQRRVPVPGPTRPSTSWSRSRTGSRCRSAPHRAWTP